VHVGKTFSDLKILGCELHQNAFGGRALPGPAGELQRSPKPALLGEGREGEERVGDREGEERGYGNEAIGRDGNGVWRKGKGRGREGRKGQGGTTVVSRYR